ncbi:MAG: hypothetical protein K8R59_03430 [Thermoanaerobaculales bacterium]|nr:hypothetical protein [Thermoanaerobaculales bacterium]
MLRRQEMERDLEGAGLVAFADVDVVRSFESGVIDVTQGNLMAGLRPNTVMFGWGRAMRNRLKILSR